MQGSTLIVGKLEEIADGGPVIVTGDFNCKPGTPSYRTFLDAGFKDVYLETGNEDCEDCDTFHGFRGPDFPAIRLGDGPIRIDYILTRGLEPRCCTVLRDAEPPLYPSDHYPLLAELTVPSAT